MSQSLFSSADGFATADPRRRRVLVAVIALTAAVSIVAGYLLISGAGGRPVAGKLSAQSRSATLGETVPGQPMTIPAAYSGAVWRDPFKPLLTPPPPTKAAVAASKTPAPSPSYSPTPIVIVVPQLTATTSPTTTAPSPTVTVTATPSPTGLPTAGQAISLTLVSVDANAVTANVTVTIGSTNSPYNGIKPGQVFGKYFKLVSILSSDPSSPPVLYGADFEYGDQFVQLTVGDSSQFD